MSDVRSQFNQLMRSILMGPFPLEQFSQENGEEILFKDSPQDTYVTGILFPQEEVAENPSNQLSETSGDSDLESIPSETLEYNGKQLGTSNNAESELDMETAGINKYKQSAMGITVCVSRGDSVTVEFSAARYQSRMSQYMLNTRDEDGNNEVKRSTTDKKCYFRIPVKGASAINSKDLPNDENRWMRYQFVDAENAVIDGISLHCTFRMALGEEYCIYTFTLMNDYKHEGKQILGEKCWFQTSFRVLNEEAGFVPMPDNYCETIDDTDYQLNSMLYKDVRTYGIGHGCSATWDEEASPRSVKAEPMPEYEVKAIVPTQSKAELSMKKYMHDSQFAVEDLEILCQEYKEWIDNKENEYKTWSASENADLKVFVPVAKQQIELCRSCLERMLKGLALLRTNNMVADAFSLMNKSMLMQQLHYKLPLRRFERFDERSLELVIEKQIVMPDPDKEDTWYDVEHNVYGKWRPFQIAFILMNLESISNRDSDERKTVDLIWFPTGGGKTEAYLGLSAFAILIRRMMNPKDAGTAVIMRYTLRLLTSQQFSRASSLVCSLEHLRREDPALLGKSPISIGLWIGHKFEESTLTDVKSKLNQIHKGKSTEDPGVVLKCPWCGASMQRMDIRTPGYDVSDDKKRIVYRCGNSKCEYSDDDDDLTLPLRLYDEEVYSNPPTVLFGTVDKFATIPFKPASKIIFGGDKIYSPPELIIQDELHLITGPLGSTVGLYETLVSELCKSNGKMPKIVASTATISHAKQQCNALYACGENRVFQFPVQGLSYRDCFFAKEDSGKPGRKYIGLYGAAASSSATASIKAFAAALYAADALEADDMLLKDPFFTNLAYFNSMRELGQAATWLSADIREHLEYIYEWRLQKYKKGRRYIYDNRLAELTSRMDSNEIPDILQQLEKKCTTNENIDICLSTNMVSVGVDVPRLGLMTVTGQPKSMSEYIQATSRVGRSHPGTVLVIYNTSKPRDRSHYEKFQSQHSKLYYSVEPTSVTPFSRPLRERAIAAVFVGLFRLLYEPDNCVPPTQEEFDRIVEIMTNRASLIDVHEVEDIRVQLEDLYSEWKHQNPQKYSCNMINPDTVAPLIYPAGSEPPRSWRNRGWAIPNSMRNVDKECRLDCTKVPT